MNRVRNDRNPPDKTKLNRSPEMISDKAPLLGKSPMKDLPKGPKSDEVSLDIF
jgi:hypothetical protein